MKRILIIASVAATLALIVTAVLAPAANAQPRAVAGARGHLSYVCPFAVTAVTADFVVTQTSRCFDGNGHGVFAAPAFGITDHVVVKLVRVAGDCVYFAGPVVGEDAWWYFAVHAGTAGRCGRAVGVYCADRNEAFRYVASGSDLSPEMDDFFAPGFFHGLQPLESGRASVW
jgi:hypothetical protein